VFALFWAKSARKYAKPNKKNTRKNSRVGMEEDKKIGDVRPRPNKCCEKLWHLDKCRQKVLTLLALLESELIATPLE
jgi:hypothetical protein